MGTASPSPSHPPQSRTAWAVFRPHLRSFGMGMGWLLVTNALALCMPRLLKHGVDGLQQGWDTRWLMALCALMVLTAVCMGFTRIKSRVHVFNVGRDVEYGLRRDLFSHLTAQPPAFYEHHGVGDLMSRATSDLSNVRLMYGFASLNIMNALFVYLGNIPLLLLIDLPLALACLAPYPLVLVAFWFLVKRVFTQTKANQEALAALSTHVQEHLAGISVVRALTAEPAEQSRFDDVNKDVYRSGVRLAMTRNLLGPTMALLGAGSTCVAIWFGAHRVMGGHISVGDLVEMNGRLAMLAWPTMAVGWIMAIWQRGKASLARVNELLTVIPAVQPPAHPQTPETRTGAATLENVGVRFIGRVDNQPVERWALQSITLQLPPRGFVGVVGATGSGKSTLAWLLPRLRDPDMGMVRVDGIDVRDRCLGALRQDVTVAPQESFLFSVSILENLRFGQPGASGQEVADVVEMLALGPDLASLPHGLHTVVGERGITLSGGQRQRVALGRALLCKPRILVLDDTVSALDAETEERVLAALKQRARDCTLVVISHRLSAVKDADQILVLHEGALVEQGQHTELLAAGGVYASLWGRERALEDLDRLDGAAREAP